MTSWALTAFVCGLWWTLSTAWRLARPPVRAALWLTLLRDLTPAPFVGLLLARLFALS
ncbi:MAG: hypothetical protein NZL87_07010 [Thermomicrobium sp.]|nr:hypothetical protein [Thermomicrobium sp.]MDW7982481.1 hypothetical protein [Thermomicrobium sp.]